MRRAFAGIIFSTLLSSTVIAQIAQTTPLPEVAKPAGPHPTFEVADVRPSPRVRFGSLYADGGVLHGDRYVLRQASIADLISRAYGIHNLEYIVGGPSWLEHNRYTIIAKAKPSTPPATLNLMLKSLLTDRFSLVAHNEDRPMPAYALTLGSDKPKLRKSADSNGEPNCHPTNPPNTAAPPDPSQPINYTCQNFSADDIVQFLQNVNQAGTPLINHTGLEGKWGFDFRYTPVKELAGAPGMGIYDLAENQLGLKLERQTTPRPVLVVDSVSELPTPNLPDIDKLLPPAPPLQFEVAVIKPSKLDTGGFTRIDNSQVNAMGITLYELIGYAWRLNQNDKQQFVNEPKWLESTRFDLESRVSIEDLGNDRYVRSDDDLRHMVQNLLIDRFHLKVHTENRPVDAYTLVAVSPKLRQADPNARTRCTEGPGPDSKDPRATNPMLDRLMTCQNISMDQFCEELSVFAAAYLYYPPLDNTTLHAGYDLTLSFSGINKVKQSAAADSDPNGAVTIFSAVNHQLGLKLEKQKRRLPVLVIDHIDEKPTEN